LHTDMCCFGLQAALGTSNRLPAGSGCTVRRPAHHMLRSNRTVCCRRGRQNVASYLALDMGLDWRQGADWFESVLLDYDVASNWGNWAAAAGVTGGRVNRFNITKQSKVTTLLHAGNYRKPGRTLGKHWAWVVCRTEHVRCHLRCSSTAPLHYDRVGQPSNVRVWHQGWWDLCPLSFDQHTWTHASGALRERLSTADFLSCHCTTWHVPTKAAVFLWYTMRRRCAQPSDCASFTHLNLHTYGCNTPSHAPRTWIR
jgi:hypothetical protein